MANLEILKETDYGTSTNMNAPPSEMFPHVLRLSITGGCSYNRCTFCNLYKGIPYQAFPLAQYKRSIDLQFKKLKEEDPDRIEDLTRVFIGDGNALSLDTKVLHGVLERTIINFRKHVGRSPRRITMYGSTQDILAKGKEDLDFLNCGGTCDTSCFEGKYDTKGVNLLYWGVESGSTEVLDYVRKGFTKEDIIQAGCILNDVKIRQSVMIMPGLGGIRLSEQHIEDTIDVLNQIRPRFLSLLPITPNERTAYFKIMQGEMEKGTNRPLTDREIAEQIRDITSNLTFNTVITSVGEKINPVIKNPFAFEGLEISIWELEEMGEKINSMFSEKF